MDVKAIIFLAPISVFDERIEGEGGLNRLEDSIKFGPRYANPSF
jgi:hypothetical protein